MYTPIGIDLPEYYEWVRGEAFPKVSPGKPHSLVQVALASELYVWGRHRGHVATENDLNVTVAADDVRRYLPDIQFTSFATLHAANDEDSVIQSVPPDLVIEIVSPLQSLAYLREKVRAYVLAGTPVVLIVDPERMTIDAHDREGVTPFQHGDRFRDERFPGLEIDVAAFFDSIPWRSSRRSSKG